MLNQCYAVFSRFNFSEDWEIEYIYRFTTDKKTAKRLAKTLKNYSGLESSFREIDPTDWGIVFSAPSLDVPLVIAKGVRYYHEAEQAGEGFKEMTEGLSVSVQKLDETIVFAMSEKEGLLGNGVFYA